MKKLVFCYIMLLIFLSCSNKRTAMQLDEIQSIVYENPDYALSSLADIDTTYLRTRLLRARYSLLNTLALNRAHIDTTNLSIIIPAFQYYENHRPDSCRMQTEYCLGWIYYNQRDWANSFVHFREAEKIVKDDTSDYFKAMLYSALSSIVTKLNMTDEQLYYSNCQLAASIAVNDVDWVRLDFLNLSAAYGNTPDMATQDSLFYKAISLLDAPDVPTNTLRYAAHSAITKRHNDPHLACRLYERVLAEGVQLSDDDWHAYAYALLLCGDDARTDRILDSLQSHPATKETDYWNYKIARRRQDYWKALNFCEDYSSSWSRELTDNLNNSVYKAIADQNEARVERQAARTERLRLTVFLILAAALAALAAMALLLYRRKVRHQAETDRLESIAETARQMADLAQEDAHSLREKYTRLQASFSSAYRSQFAELGRLCEQGLLRAGQEARKELATGFQAGQVEKLLAEIGGGEDRQGELEAEINRNLDDAVSKLRNDFPDLNDKDILFVCYLILHFHTSTIAILTGYSKENVRQKRHRLQKKILSAPGPNAELYRLLIE